MKKTPSIWLLLIILLAFALRVYRLDASPLRGDEAFTVQYWVMVPLSETIAEQLTVDPQPLLAYAAYNAWGQIVGIHTFALRMLPALIGTLGTAAVYLFAQYALKNRRAAQIAALAWAVHPFLIWHSQDLRNYALWSTASIIGLAAALQALKHQRKQDWFWLIVFSALAGYLYYLQLFVLFAISLYVLLAYWGRWRIIGTWVVSMLAVGVMLAPWYLQPALLSGGGYGGTTVGFSLSKLMIDFPNVLMFGLTMPTNLYPWGIITLAAIWLISLAGLAQHDWRQAVLLFMVGFIPPILLGLVSTRLNVFAPRYVLASIPAYLVLIGAVIMGKNRAWRLIGVLPVVIWAIFISRSLFDYYTVYAKTAAWPSLTGYLSDHVSENDLVIQAAADASFGYYYHYVDDIPADERALPERPEQPAADIEQALTEASQQYDSLWLAAQGFTDWPNYGVVENWLDSNMQQVINTNADGLRIQQYRPYAVTEALSDSPLATFDEVVTLADVQPLTIQPTGELVVAVYWQPQKTTDAPYKAFVQLVGAINPATNTPVWSQDDHEPQHGRTPTTTWQPDTLIRDVFVLPDVTTLPDGDYSLHIGLYHTETGERLMLDDGSTSYVIPSFTFP